MIDKTGLAKDYQPVIDISMEDMRTFMSKQSSPGGGGAPLAGFGSGLGVGRGGGFGRGGTGRRVDFGVSAATGLKLETQKAPIVVVVD